MTRIAIVASAALSLTLAGCGGGAPQPTQGAAERAVYTNAKDCDAHEKLDIDACTTLVEKAIAEHDKAATKYTSQRACEAAEGGADKCERFGDKQFRAKMMAFLVTLSTPPVAVPLYPTLDGKPGFRMPDKTVLLGTDESLSFSPRAVAAYEQHAAQGKKKGMF